MKRTMRCFSLLLTFVVVLSCGGNRGGKVLVIARGGGEAFESFLLKEIPLMTRMLKDAGYSYKVATLEKKLLSDRETHFRQILIFPWSRDPTIRVF
jgi:hypothetical protein